MDGLQICSFVCLCILCVRVPITRAQTCNGTEASRTEAATPCCNKSPAECSKTFYAHQSGTQYFQCGLSGLNCVSVAFCKPAACDDLGAKLKLQVKDNAVNNLGGSPLTTDGNGAMVIQDGAIQLNRKAIKVPIVLDLEKQDFTFMSWIKPTGVPTGHGHDGNIMLFGGAWSDGNAMHLYSYSSSTGGPKIYLGRAGNHQELDLNKDYAHNDDTWHHLALTRSNSGKTWKFYFDGEETFDRTFEDSEIAAQSLRSDTEWWVGGRAATGSTCCTNVDDRSFAGKVYGLQVIPGAALSDTAIRDQITNCNPSP